MKKRQEPDPFKENLLSCVEDDLEQNASKHRGADNHLVAGDFAENFEHLPADSPDFLHDLGDVDSAPAHLKTSRRRWMCLAALCLSCGLASGPIGAWPTIEPLLIDAGVFAQEGKAMQKAHLNTVFSIAAFSQLIGSLPFGWLYDRIGGRPLSLW
jgi:hypothetical protein